MVTFSTAFLDNIPVQLMPDCLWCQILHVIKSVHIWTKHATERSSASTLELLILIASFIVFQTWPVCIIIFNLCFLYISGHWDCQLISISINVFPFDINKNLQFQSHHYWPGASSRNRSPSILTHSLIRLASSRLFSQCTSSKKLRMEGIRLVQVTKFALTVLLIKFSHWCCSYWATTNHCSSDNHR